MGPQELIKILENRIVYNTQQRDAAQVRGDLDTVQFFDLDIASTTASLNLLLEAVNG